MINRALVAGGAIAIWMVCLAPAPVAGQATPEASPPPSSSGQLQTPDRSATDNLPSAAAAPLHDLNVMRQGIPPILLEAIANPYDPPSPLSCRELTRQVRALKVALGADFDEPDTPQDPSLTRKNGRLALALIHGAAESLLPFAGFVRTLSGAQRHDQLIIEAITAGSVRRGYLKGLGEAIRCRPPAIPGHPLHPPSAVRENGPEPKYPIH